MIIIMKPNASDEAVQKVTHIIESKGLQVHLSKGSQVTIVGVVGDKTRLLGSNIEISEGVDKVVAVTESYKLVNKKFHPEDSVIPVGNTHIGPGTMTVMAGPAPSNPRTSFWRLPLRSRRLAPHSSAEAPISPAPPPTPSRAWRKKGLSI